MLTPVPRCYCSWLQIELPRISHRSWSDIVLSRSEDVNPRPSLLLQLQIELPRISHRSWSYIALGCTLTV